MTILNTYTIVIPVVMGYMSLFFIVAVVKKDNSIADIAWGPGFLVAALAAMLSQEAWGDRNIAVTALAAFWGLRLAIRIGRRNAGRGEDWRYRHWRETWGRFFYLRSWLQVFMLQGLILLVNASPLIIVNAMPSAGPAWSDAAGLCLWLTGFAFESVADWQMDRFKKDPANKGRFITTGLWRYSRHPNYFGEITLWWGFFVIALGVPWGCCALAGPLMITFMLVFVSGIPLTERARARDEAYQAYRRRTNALVPWFPRR